MTERALKIRVGKCNRLIDRMEESKQRPGLIYITEDERNLVIQLCREFLQTAEEKANDTASKNSEVSG